MKSIYGIIDQNHLIYVGQTGLIKTRAWQHRKRFPDCDVVVLDEVPVSSADESEMFWIHYMKSIGCNLQNKTIYHHPSKKLHNIGRKRMSFHLQRKHYDQLKTATMDERSEIVRRAIDLYFNQKREVGK